MTLARDIASRAAVYLDNARLYTREHDTAVTLQRSLLGHLALYTDGLVETRDADLDERLNQLRDVLSDSSALPLDGLSRKAVALLAPAPDDDVALLLVRISRRE
ncbi:SpoIIE family protein phosphatase [Streptomyces sp. SJL17-1]|uniref:SpoIIE family protein phosphatase n=1 Tax=Streptomyces sp. SJL17-1 TaxID=2967223 RepID=UPI002965D25D|nr:SpoIIE family protein phosphatase [Streptomyces sp. SJL17-1]